jgi:uridine monophosphate synthetase
LNPAAFSFTPAEEDLAVQLFDIGAVQFGEFKLKLHEKNPNAPLSPIFFNFRTPDNPKPGPITEEVLKLIGQVLYSRALKLWLEYDHIAGIPHAGTPLAETFFKTELADTGAPSQLRFKKLQEGEKRRIGELIGEGFDEDEVVLLIDDLITEADTKFEAIVETEKAGLQVDAVLVLLDREQGGRQQLEVWGYKVVAIYQLWELLAYYAYLDRIDQATVDKIMAYVRENP